MTEPKKNMRIEKVKELFAQWKDYYIIGNKPYAKGCLLMRKARRGVRAMIVHTTGANWQMYELGCKKNWHPSDLDYENPDEPMIDEPILTGTDNRRNFKKVTLKLYNKLIDFANESNDLSAGLLGRQVVSDADLNEMRQNRKHYR